MSFSYTYPRPALTVDCVVFGWDGEELKILLIERGQAPFEGQWALPGGFVQVDETLATAAIRELQEETGLKTLYLEQLYTFDAVERDPRERIITVAYFALIDIHRYAPPQGDSDARGAEWFSIQQKPALAFDHASILEKAKERLRGKVRYQPIGFELLPEIFTFPQLQALYEAILNQAFDRRNFRKKLLSMGILIEEGELQGDFNHRAPKLYRFDRKRYQELEEQGFQFRI